METLEADKFIGGFVEDRQIGEDLKVEGDCLKYKLTATDNFLWSCQGALEVKCSFNGISLGNWTVIVARFLYCYT